MVIIRLNKEIVNIFKLRLRTFLHELETITFEPFFRLKYVALFISLILNTIWAVRRLNCLINFISVSNRTWLANLFYDIIYT